MINKKLGDTGCLWKGKLGTDMKVTVHICILLATCVYCLLKKQLEKKGPIQVTISELP